MGADAEFYHAQTRLVNCGPKNLARGPFPAPRGAPGKEKGPRSSPGAP
jgi:hypothetical protein